MVNIKQNLTSRQKRSRAAVDYSSCVCKSGGEAARGSLPAQRPHSDQAISYEHSTESEGVRPGPGLKLSWSMHALTNRSHRLQATSFKQQAPSNKLDMKDIMGYINLMIGLLIGQCAQAWNLQSSPPLKSRGVGGNSGLQAKPFFIYPKIQASSGKHQAPSSKHQATSRKQQAPGSGTLQKVSSTFDQGTLPR